MMSVFDTPPGWFLVAAGVLLLANHYGGTPVSSAALIVIGVTVYLHARYNDD